MKAATYSQIQHFITQIKKISSQSVSYTVNRIFWHSCRLCTPFQRSNTHDKTYHIFSSQSALRLKKCNFFPLFWFSLSLDWKYSFIPRYKKNLNVKIQYFRYLRSSLHFNVLVWCAQNTVLLRSISLCSAILCIVHPIFYGFSEIR